MAKHDIWELKSMQSAPLAVKEKLTMSRIYEWIDEYGTDGVYVAFSGGKDSTVLLHMIRQEFPEIPAVFVNTGLEYPSVQRFAKSQENVIELRPKLTFTEIVRKYGYPVISKEVAGKVDQYRRKPDGSAAYNFEETGSMFDYSSYRWLTKAPFKVSSECCDISKKSPAISYANETGKKPFIATMAEESRLRRQKWLLHGCNAFDTEHPQSNPMTFWTENDVLAYIHRHGLKIAEAYGNVVSDQGDEVKGQQSIYDFSGDYTGCKFRTTGCSRTGCVFCMFGIRSDTSRFMHLAETEPKICDHVMRGGCGRRWHMAAGERRARVLVRLRMDEPARKYRSRDTRQGEIPAGILDRVYGQNAWAVGPDQTSKKDGTLLLRPVVFFPCLCIWQVEPIANHFLVNSG